MQALIELFDSSADGETVTVTIDGEPQVVTVQGRRASLQVPFTGSSATVELVDPPACLPAQTVTCQ